MDLGTIEITPEEATERLAEIEAVLDRERTAEDVALAQAYRAAKRGYGVISMTRAFETAGIFPSGRPKLGLVAADIERVRVDVSGSSHHPGSTFTFSNADIIPSGRQRTRLVGKNHTLIHCPALQQPEWSKQTRQGTTIVPSIPPRFRPKPRKLGACHILWEVEKWDPTPPVDPALVKHIRGDLWAVLATWDLTELERLVLTQRA